MVTYIVAKTKLNNHWKVSVSYQLPEQNIDIQGVKICNQQHVG